MKRESPVHEANVGRPVERVEDERMLRGRGRYVDDVRCPDALHAAIVRSNVAHGRIVAINADAARKLPGVRDVIVASDIARACGGRVPTTPLRLAAMPQLVPFEQPVMAFDKVRYVGEPIAMVIADSAAIAEDGAELVEVEIDPLDAVADVSSGSRTDVLLFEAAGTNCPVTYQARKGELATLQAPYVRKERFSVQRHTAVTMEGRGVLARWDAAQGKMTVWGAAKVPFNTRKLVAQGLGLPEGQVDAIESDAGGGFGVRGEFYPEDLLIPFAARRLNRPVKWVEDRRENLLSSNHAREMEAELELHCQRDGRILALTGKILVDAGAYLRTTAAIPIRNVGQAMSGPYRIPVIHLESVAVVTNKTPIGTYRAPGRFEADFFRERLFDIVAKDLAIDPVEFRRRNLITRDELPYPLATLTPIEKTDELDTGDYAMTLDRCLREIQWEGKQALRGKLVDGKFHGLAVGCFIEGGAAGPKETARLVVEPDGTVTVLVGSTSVGQGVETVLLQIASDALGLPMSRLQIQHGSTTLLAEGYGSFHSRSTVMGGCAILDAVKRLQDRVRDAASARLGCAPAEVEIERGLTAAYGGKTVTLAALAEEKLAADGEFLNHHHTYAYGAAAAHVTVDAETGRVEVLDYVTVEDLGRVVNPLTAAGQAVGASVQGLGGALLEHLMYDDQGQLLTGTLADYLMPIATDFPNVRAVMLGEYPSPHNPLGAKGGGEGGTVPVGGVIANAVSCALSSLGVEVRQLPLSPANVWQLVQERNGEARG